MVETNEYIFYSTYDTFNKVTAREYYLIASKLVLDDDILGTRPPTELSFN